MHMKLSLLALIAAFLVHCKSGSSRHYRVYILATNKNGALPYAMPSLRQSLNYVISSLHL
jgi:hypothetical protein